MPSTKRTSPAKSPAEEKKVSPPPSLAPQPDLPETVDMIIDAVSEMLTHGGDAEDVDRLIQAAMAHTKRRQVSGIFDDKPEEIPKLVARFVESRQADWKSDLLLGEAFAFELDRDETYIRVPRGLRQPVQRYIDALRAIDVKDVA